MNLTQGQGRILFAIIVVAFAGLGAFLLLPHLLPHPARSHAGGPSTGRVSTSPVVPPTASPTPSIAGPVPDAVSPSATPRVDIYRLLPFTQSGLDQAVAVTQQFAADYGTYSYRMDAARYVATMRGLVTAELAATLARGYATPGVAQMRTRQKKVSSGSATVTGLRAFGPSSLTFVVTTVARITTVQGRSQLTGDYAVTVTLVGGRWQVNDIELAAAGNS